MDLTLERLRIPPLHGGCLLKTSYCADNEAFERLVSELAVTVAPNVSTGAATIGPAGFYLGVSSSLTPISANQQTWQRGTEGSGNVVRNGSPDGALLWNRLFVRKGLPFGLELGTSVGQGANTSMWVLSAEVKWALLEGFHSGTGHFPDLAVHGALSSTVGARALTLSTNTLDLTLSKPYVVGGSYRLTPFVAAQLLFVRAHTSGVDLTPATNASVVASDAANNVVFNPVTQTRGRAFAGFELRHELIITALSVGYDLAVPTLRANNPKDGLDGKLARQIAFQLSLGLRY